MAISSSSSDFPLASINKNFTFNPAKTSPIRLFLSHLSSSSSRLQILNSSSSSYPPILEDGSTNCQDFQDSSVPESEYLNAMICNLFKDSKTEELGFECYLKAKRNPDFVPERSTLHHLIRYAMRLEKWNLVWSISEDIRKFNVYPDTSYCCRIISSCIRARRFKLANNLLQVLKFENEVACLTFNSAMKAYNKLHMYSSTVTVFEIMKSSGVELDAECYAHTMEAHLKMGKNENVVSLFEELQSSELKSTSFGSQIYRILCESLGKSGKPVEALGFFREMMNKGFPEDPSFYSSLISSFVSIKDVDSAEELLKEAKGKKMLRDPSVFLKLVLMYIDLGSLEKTLDIVSYMKEMNIKVSDCIFCAIVNGFSRQKEPAFAAKVYEDLVSQGCVPGQVTYASVLNVYSRTGLYKKAEGVFWEMENKGFDKCVVAYSSMIAMYGKTNRIRDAMRLVAKMKEKGVEPNVWIYNSLLDMHGKVLNLKQVEKIWKEMKRRKVSPDKVSYTSVISAYSKAREFETCVNYYNEYRLNGGRIDRAMGGIMVGVYSKMSRVDELVKLLQDMNAEGTRLDARLYRSSLNALRDAAEMDPEMPQQGPQQQGPPLDPESLALSQHEWLQFEEGSAALMRCRRILRMTVPTPRCIDWGLLADVGEAARARAILGEDTPWTRLFDIADMPTYRLITVEFLSTFRYRAHQAAVREEDDEELPPDVEFSLCGQHVEMSIERFAVHLGLYYEPETVRDDFTQGLTQGEEGVMRAWWSQMDVDFFKNQETMQWISAFLLEAWNFALMNCSCFRLNCFGDDLLQLFNIDWIMLLLMSTHVLLCERKPHCHLVDN
ncbi:hypothetical protein E3N88_30944 [Mikania micrantha]|uniref:Pentacotripeptide-repeat region of PRORP domain-containing protein n=1 Tax=Mikania micrantha TaxID=192012 RepID=A0A5N6MN92_9ASTR|nr:hypothetical protein E3N88_30944 [Mikania micrantha]